MTKKIPVMKKIFLLHKNIFLLSKKKLIFDFLQNGYLHNLVLYLFETVRPCSLWVYMPFFWSYHIFQIFPFCTVGGPGSKICPKLTPMLVLKISFLRIFTLIFESQGGPRTPWTSQIRGPCIQPTRVYLCPLIKK